MHGGQQCVEVLEGSERRVDVLVVADVVAGVVLRRRVDRAQPQHVHAEIGQVIEPVRHAGKVANPVTVGKTARIDLVDDGRLPRRLTCSGFGAGRLGHAYMLSAGTDSCGIRRQRHDVVRVDRILGTGQGR